MFTELREEGMDITDEQRAIIFGPAGLDIGAEAPEEIALSILAEIKTVLANHPAGFLRNRSQTIHSGPTHRIHNMT